MKEMTVEEILNVNEDVKQVIINLHADRYGEYLDEWAVDEVMQNILNYCNVKVFPIELRFVAVQMVHAVVAPEDGEEGKSISVGDTRVELSKKDVVARAESVLLDFRSQLQEFRKLRW